MFFFFNDTATTEIYTLSLHDALPILRRAAMGVEAHALVNARWSWSGGAEIADRKSTRLNSSHLVISYAVFCLKKKKRTAQDRERATTPAHRRDGPLVLPSTAAVRGAA